MCDRAVAGRKSVANQHEYRQRNYPGHLAVAGRFAVRLSIGQYNTPTSFTATGLTRGIITDIFNNVTWVNFK